MNQTGRCSPTGDRPLAMTADELTVGFLHPGQMGESLARHCTTSSKVWVRTGRSAATATRAHAADLHDLGSIEALAETADVIVSICPPAAALDVATDVARAGFGGVFVDANAVSPATALRIGAMFERFVDGGVVGPPADQPGTTRLYLSGAEAPMVASLWSGSWVDARDIGADPSAASALKMAYASWTKGSSALLMAAHELAEAHGVGADLTTEWELSIPGLAERYERTVAGTQPKAWRFVGEMHEIAESMTDARLPDGFHRAAAEIYERMADSDPDGL